MNRGANPTDQQETTQPRGRNRFGRVLLVLLLLVSLVCLAGGYGYVHLTSPQRMRALVKDKLSAWVQGDIFVGAARFSPTEGVAIEGLQIRPPLNPTKGRRPGDRARESISRLAWELAPDARPHVDNDEPVFECPKLQIKQRLWPLLVGRFEVEEIRATNPSLNVIWDESTGRHNLAGLLQPGGGAADLSAAGLPRMRMDDVRLRLGKRSGSVVRVVEDVLFDLLAEQADSPHLYRLDVKGIDDSSLHATSLLDLEEHSMLELSGELPWMKLEGAFLAADLGVAGASQWRELLGLHGEFRVRRVALTSEEGQTPERRVVVDLRGAALSVPLDDQENAAPLSKRFLRFRGVRGTLSLGTQHADAHITGMLNGSRARLSAGFDLTEAGTADWGALGMDLELDVDQFLLPLQSADADSADARFVARWKPLRDFYRDFDPHGLTNLSVRVSKRAGTAKPVKLERLSLEAIDCDASFLRFPYRVYGLTGKVVYSPEGVFLHNLVGRHGEGKIIVNGRMDEMRRHASAELHLHGKNVPLNESLYAALRDRHKRIWSQFEIDGNADIDVWLQRDRGEPGETMPWRTEISARLIDVNGCYPGFAYPLDEVSGVVEVTDDELRVYDLHGVNGDTQVTLQACAFLGESTPDGESVGTGVTLNIDARQVLLDEELERVLPAASGVMLACCNARGVLDVWGTVEVGAMCGAEYDLTAEIRDADMTHCRAPIPLESMRGSLRLSNDTITLHQVQGMAGDTLVVADGWIHPEDNGGENGRGGQSEVTIRCRDLSFDDDAWKSTLGSVTTWLTGLHVSGRADTVSTIRSGGTVDGRSQAQHVIDARGLTMRHDSYDVAVTDVHGRIRISDDRLELGHVSAQVAGAAFSLDGAMSTDPARRFGSFSGSATDVPFNDQVRELLPWRMKRAWNHLNPRGRFDLDLSELSFATGNEGKGLAWRFNGIATFHQAAFDLGTELSDFDGTLRGKGSTVADGDMEFDGELRAEHARVAGIPVEHFSGRLRRDAAGNRIDLTEMQATVYGGSATGALQIDYQTASPEFACNATATGMRLEQFIGDSRARRAQHRQPVAQRTPQVDHSDRGRSATPGKPHAIHQERNQMADAGRAPTGLIDASVFLSGRPGHDDALRGGGRVRVDGKNLFRTPLMLSILDVLHWTVPPEEAEQSATTDFHLVGDAYTLSNLRIKDASFALVGDGELARNHSSMDLELTAVLGGPDLRVFVLSDLVEGTAKEIVELRVQGTPTDPQVTAKPLRRIQGVLETLFGARR